MNRFFGPRHTFRRVAAITVSLGPTAGAVADAVPPAQAATWLGRLRENARGV